MTVYGLYMDHYITYGKLFKDGFPIIKDYAICVDVYSTCVSPLGPDKGRSLSEFLHCSHFSQIFRDNMNLNYTIIQVLEIVTLVYSRPVG